MKRGQTWMYPFDGFDWLGHFDGKSDLEIVADVRQACVDLKGHAVSPSGKTFVDLCARNVEAIKLARSEKIRAGLEKKKGTENTVPPGNAESGCLQEGGGDARASDTTCAHPEAHAVESASGSSDILGHEQRPSGAGILSASENLSAGTPEASVRKEEEGDKSPVLCTSGAPAMVSRKEAREAFEAFRKAFPGTRRGAAVEWENFSKKNFPEDAPLLMPALMREMAHKEECARVGAFVPEWANLSTWINQRRWTQELPRPRAQQIRKTSEDLENDKKARMLRWLKDREAGIPTGENYDEIPEAEPAEDDHA